MANRAHTNMLHIQASITHYNDRVHAGHQKHAPHNRRVTQAQARGYIKGVSNAEVRQAMQPPVGALTKGVAKRGLSIREEIAGRPWLRKGHRA